MSISGPRPQSTAGSRVFGTADAMATRSVRGACPRAAHRATRGLATRQGALRFAGPTPSRRGEVLPRNRPGEV